MLNSSFTDRMWPDFDESDLEAALKEFARRDRRFGGVTTIMLHSGSESAGGTALDGFFH